MLPTNRTYRDTLMAHQSHTGRHHTPADRRAVCSQIMQARAVRQLQVTLLVPRNKDLKPAIIYFPGGGFISADYAKFFEGRSALANADFAVAAANYRVIPNKFPALVEDCKAAVCYLRFNAGEYGIVQSASECLAIRPVVSGADAWHY